MLNVMPKKAPVYKITVVGWVEFLICDQQIGPVFIVIPPLAAKV